MKQHGKNIVIGVLCAALLTGCMGTANTQTPTDENDRVPTSQMESNTDDSEVSADLEDSSSSAQNEDDFTEQDANTPTSAAQKEDAGILQKAVTLTEHLVNDSFPYHAEKGFSTPEDLVKAGDGFTIYRFVYAQHKYFDELADPYYGFFDSEKLKTDMTAIVPLKDAQRIASEVFGSDNWPESKDLDNFDQETECFNFPLEVGEYSMYTAQNISPEQVDSQTIAVTFDLVDVDFDNAAISHGKYKITYQILTDGDREFLRFKSCLPC